MMLQQNFYNHRMFAQHLFLVKSPSVTEAAAGAELHGPPAPSQGAGACGACERLCETSTASRVHIKQSSGHLTSAVAS